MPIDFSQFKPMDFTPWAGGFNPLQYLPQASQQIQNAPTPGGTPPAAPPGPGGAPDAGVPAGGSGTPATVDVGGVTLPAPQAAQLPSGGPAPQQPSGGPAPQQPSGGPAPQQPMSRAGRIRESIIGAIAGDAPQGYAGLLTPDEIKTARPSLLQSLFPAQGEPNAASRWQRNLDSLVEHKMLATNVARAQQLQSQRSDVEKQLGPAPDDPEGFNKWARKAYGAYASIGDVENVTKLNTIMQQILASQGKEKGEAFKNAQTGETRFFPTTPGSVIPAGFEPLQKQPPAGETKQYIDSQGNVHVLPPNVDPPKGWKVASTFNVQLGQEGANARHSDQLVSSLQKQFRSDIAPQAKDAKQYDKALYTLNRATSSTDPNERKMLYGSVMSQFVQSSDQPNNLRFQLLQYYEKNINPSVAGNFNIFLDKMSKGELPRPIINGMMNHLKGMQQLTRTEIEAKRKGFLNTNAGKLDETDLPSTDTYFPYAGQYGSTSSTAPAPQSGSYSPENPFAKKGGK